MNSDCPPDDQLLALAADEPSAAEMVRHVEHCDACQIRVKRLCEDIAELRSLSSLVATVNTNRSATLADSPLPNGTTIDRYVIVASLGSGGQAELYRVIDSSLARHLVLKLSRRQPCNDNERRDGLFAEGRVLAELDHPGLIRVLDVGTYCGRPYLVLEHVAGRNLEQIFANNKPSAREAVRLIAEVARVVAYLHRRGIVHGDMTPRNILLDGNGRTRLIDFGLSKIEDAWNKKTDLLGGTPEFLPPEMVPANGQPGRAGPAGDVFGLGAILYWLLTGQPPFLAASAADALERARRCEIDFDALRRVRAPGRIVRVSRHALAADPSDRPTSEILANELEPAPRRWTTALVFAMLVTVDIASVGLTLGMHGFRAPESTKNISVVHSVPMIGVIRPEGIRTLSNVSPLRTGDRVQVGCSVAQGQRAIGLWFNAAGELRTLAPVRDVANRVDRLVYPSPHQFFTLEPSAGTEMFFFCRGEPIADSEMQTCFPSGTMLPILPAHNYLTLQRSEVRIEGPVNTEIPDEIVTIEETMKAIDRKLRRHFQGVTGIALPHYPAKK
jgi:serine/threonine protein kinase